MEPGNRIAAVRLERTMWQGSPHDVMLARGIHWDDAPTVHAAVVRGRQPIILVPQIRPSDDFWTTRWLPVFALSQVATLVRTRQRKRHGIAQRMQSLSDELTSPDGKTEPLAATSSRDDLARRLGIEPSDETHLTETTEAVAADLQRMPADLRDLCRRLMGGTVTSVARDLSVSRRQVRNRLREARPYLEQAGEEF